MRLALSKSRCAPPSSMNCWPAKSPTNSRGSSAASLWATIERTPRRLDRRRRERAEWISVLHQFLNAQRRIILMSRRSEGMLLFWPTDDPKSARHLKSAAADLAAMLISHAPKAKVIIGLGRPATRPGEWLRSLQQAQESWHMGKSWHTAPVTYFGDLGTLSTPHRAGRQPGGGALLPQNGAPAHRTR
ncbi:MAG: hypothetical protein R2856_03450 [Caldilineaceae bacterium]